MKETNIQWCDSTINGSSGCNGCELYRPPPAEIRTDAAALRAWLEEQPCYAAQLHELRWAGSLAVSFPQHYSPHFYEVKMIPGRFAEAARWSDLRGKDRPGKPWLNGRPRHIFVGDMGDFLSNEVTDEFLTRELLGAIRSPEGQRHVWMLLTKRPARLARLSREWGGLPGNVIAMTTVTNQPTANSRIPQLLNVQCQWRGVSFEPMLSEIELEAVWLGGYETCAGFYPQQIHLGIIGGESGPRARWFHAEAAWDVLMTLRQHRVAPFVKQLGSRPVTSNANAMEWPEDTVFLDQGGVAAAGARVKLRDPKGGDIAEFPEELRVRELPMVA